MISIVSSSCEASGEECDARDHEPSLGAGDGLLEVLGEAAVATEPGEGSLDHPASRFGFEGADILRARDDFDRPFSAIGNRIEQLVTAIKAVGGDVLKFEIG